MSPLLAFPLCVVLLSKNKILFHVANQLTLEQTYPEHLIQLGKR